MRIYRDGVSLPDSLHRLCDTLKLLHAFRHNDDRNRHIEKTLVILPDIIHDGFDLLFLRPLRIRDFRGKIVILVTHPLLFDNVRFDTKILFLQHLGCDILWHRYHIYTGDAVDRERCDLI